ncbi:hypothetical protein GALL_172220 [mine drainage metagenome]|uniref:Phosphodiester glycosidase domain-containing protein n=1 Tax=mine drainage metagenome TaxID=410659 RepID=A0A1J5RX07_9ZZZZ
MKKLFIIFFFIPLFSSAQLQWKNVDSLYQPLPKNTHVFFSNDSLDSKPNIAYYFITDLKNKEIDFAADAKNGTRLTPTQYFEKDDHPLLVVNCTFFEFVHNSNLNLAVNDGKVLANSIQTIANKGKDTLTYKHVFKSAIGIDEHRNADVAWVLSDTTKRFAYVSQTAIPSFKDSVNYYSYKKMKSKNIATFNKWKIKTAVGGGPVLIQDAEIKISNNEEQMFAGKAINDKHPRTAMGYTNDGKLIVMVIEGRFPGIAEGATLTQEAKMLKDLNCKEALNLDGGGSSCMLINGKQTIKPSDKEGPRPVPSVFIVRKK